MSRGSTIRLYVNGAETPSFTIFSPDGINYTDQIGLPDGTYSIQVTAQKVGETESAKSAAKIVVVGAATAPVITSPADWDEIKTELIAVAVQANAGDILRLFANGAQKDTDKTANGSGIASFEFIPDSLGIIGLDPVEVITVCRVVGGNLSHPAVIHVVPTYGRVAASGVTTARIIQTSALLGWFRYNKGGLWDNEIISDTIRPYACYHAYGDSGEDTGIPVGYRTPNPASYWGGLASGYLDPVWLRRHLERANISALGKSMWHSAIPGQIEDFTTPYWPSGFTPLSPYVFDICLLVAACYFRGDKSVYGAYKNKLIECMDNATRHSTGLITQFAYLITRTNLAPLGTDPEFSGRWGYAVQLFKRMAQLEDDAATVTKCDSFLASLVTPLIDSIMSGTQTGLTINGVINACIGDPAFYPTNGWSATIWVLLSHILNATAETDMINAMLTACTNRFGGYLVINGGIYCNTSFMAAGGLKHSGLRFTQDGNDGYGHPYHVTYLSGPFAEAIKSVDPTLARQHAEDSVKNIQCWFNSGITNWVGFNWPSHIAATERWGHDTGATPTHTMNTAAWLQDADDKYADIIAPALSGAVNSTAILYVPEGHRITGVEITASTPCTSATLQFIANENAHGSIRLYEAGLPLSATVLPNGWTVGAACTYGSDIPMNTLTMSGSSGSILSGFRSSACYSGGKITVKLSAVSWPSSVGTFTVTFKQAKISPTFAADESLGFPDTFATNRLSEYTAIEGSKTELTVVTATDQIETATPVTRSPLMRTDLIKSGSGWTTVIQTNSNFSDGVVMLDKVRDLTTPATRDGNNTPHANTPYVKAIFRYNPANGGSYIEVRNGPTVGSWEGEEWIVTDHGLRIDEVIDGVVVHTHFPVGPAHGGNAWYDMSTDEFYFLASVVNNVVKVTYWVGGPQLPLDYGVCEPQYGGGAYGGEFTLVNTFPSGSVGFGMQGPAKVGTARISGYPDQPIPPGYILDTGVILQKNESNIPSCFISGELVAPVTDTCCLRNEWGAQVSETVTGYNARWSY